MAGNQDGDPFLWDVTTVSEELCAHHHPWIRDPEQDASALTKRILEEEIDGYTLLTYEYYYSKIELMESLGIKPAGRRGKLAHAIKKYQDRSACFQSWKADFLKDRSAEPDPTNPRPSPTAGANGPENAPSRAILDALPSPNQSESKEPADQGVAGVHEGGPGLVPESDAAPSIQLPNEGENHSLDPNPFSEADLAESLGDETPPVPTRPVDDDGLVDGDRPSKRRRIAPINLSAQLFDDSNPLTSTMPSESFNLVDGTQRSAGHRPNLQENSTWHAYLGRGKLDMLAVKSPAGSASSRLMKIDQKSFATLSPNRLPLGQRIVVAHTMRNLLVKNSRKEALINQGLATIRSPSPSEGSGDEIVNLEDLPDSWDEETLREIAEEKAEMEAREREQARYLTQDDVENILKKSIQDMTAKWEEMKLPRYQRKAYKLWTDVRRRERTKKSIIEAQQQAEFYDRRIRKLCAEILKDRWQKEEEVCTQARVMEQSLEDKLYRLWLIGLLESRVPPPKPQGIPKPKAQPKAPSTFMDDEILTSSDEDDFIIPDEEENDNGIHESAQAVNSSPALSRRHKSSTPFERESSMYVDLTQLESPEKLPDGEAARDVIDLTVATPVKLKSEAQTSPIRKEARDDVIADIIADTPPIDQLGSMSTIGELPPTHWAKQKDRWRLIICMMWKLTQARRQWILGMVQEKSAPEVWDASIKLQMSKPLTQESQIEKDDIRTAAFDLTRIFLSFLRCRHSKEARIMKLEKKDINRLRDSKRGLFPAFCAFIKEVAPDFPQDSQIFRPDAFDEEIEGEEDAGEVVDDIMNTPSKRKHVAKEIVQNKEGVDLRERERRRVEEQETRRLKLRANLAASDLMAVDKSRIIINESKQDDQSFIYVNEEIGKRIKEHQIEGVRFLWNQVVLDADVRQGCLLAHTMGLGKTMQVITFLVAIREAATSEDVSVQAQIPEDLRKSKTLIICPSGLVDNWMDEILLWAPAGLLGHLRKIESRMPEEDRLSSIKDWEREGGVMIIGYDLFKMTGKKHEKTIAPILFEAPNIVVADEAHNLKNPNSQLHQVCEKFQTRSRIALTGSPLANNVEEYFTMINWVAPNFLGPIEEFRNIYANPIQRGLWHDSSGSDKRTALKRLETLKMTVAPKVQRATIQCVRNDLPPKYEFVISVAPTEIQKRLYGLYLNGVVLGVAKASSARVFGMMNDLTLLCNHPRCFHQKAQDIRRKVQNGPDGAESSFPDGIIPAVLKETNGHDRDNPALSRKVEFLLLILDEARKVGDKVLVFSQSILTIDFLENLLQMQQRRVCRLDGSTAVSKRQEMIKSFNTGNQEVYLISTNAGGVGLNIQSANRVVVFDFKWNPVAEQQAVGRAYRFGQKKTVFVYRFLVAGSCEEGLQNKTVFKMQLASRVVDKKNPISWGKRLSSLFRPLDPVPAKDLSPFLNLDSVLDKLIRDKGEAIRQIVSTDTFEEEDHMNQLTAEEKGEAQELYNAQRVRHTDPARYDRLVGEIFQAEQSRMFQPTTSQFPNNQSPQNATHDLYIPSVNQSMDGASDSPLVLPPPQAQHGVVAPGNAQPQPVSTMPTTAPLPMAGANTYFGKDAETAPSMDTRLSTRLSTTSQSPMGVLEATPATKKPGLFSQPRSQSKQDFENKLVSIIESLTVRKMPESAEPAKDVSQAITSKIDKHRKEQAFGFLPDNQHWRLLLDVIEAHSRVVPAIVSGSWTPRFLALSTVEEIQRRVALLESLSEEEFQAQLHRKGRARDPDNLDNIHRSYVQSPRALEDMEVMRQAVDRRQRSFRLPTWASKVLSENRSETS